MNPDTIVTQIREELMSFIEFTDEIGDLNYEKLSDIKNRWDDTAVEIDCRIGRLKMIADKAYDKDIIKPPSTIEDDLLALIKNINTKLVEP